jgi:hypothetical protein
MSDGDKTAKPKTAKETAKLLGISERQLYKACASEILRWGRSDLMKKVQAGEMSIHAAWLETAWIYLLTEGQCHPRAGRI